MTVSLKICIFVRTPKLLTMNSSEEASHLDLIDVLSNDLFKTPTFTYHEVRVRDLILGVAHQRSFEVEVDETGNVYVSNGPSLDPKNNEGEEYYPCVVAHMDTVHDEHIEYVHCNRSLDVQYSDGIYKAYDPIDGKQTGIGGDDKAGIVIALTMLARSEFGMKGAFFISEENGCQGSGNMKKPYLLTDVGYFIQFDAPGNDWVSMNCSGVDLFHKDFKEDILLPVLKEHERNEGCFSNDPYTDVKELRKQFGVCCVNLFAGYHGMHTPFETVSKPEMEESFNLASDLIERLGYERYDFPYAVEEQENSGNVFF